MKHLKLRAELDKKDKTFCFVEVVEQTHRRLDFGVNFNGAGSFVCGEIMLLSWREPVWWDNQLGGTYRLYLRGRDVDYDKRKVRVPTNMWHKIKAAVLAYNEFYSGEDGGKKEVRVQEKIGVSVKTTDEWKSIVLAQYVEALEKEIIYGRPEIVGTSVSLFGTDYLVTTNGD